MRRAGPEILLAVAFFWILALMVIPLPAMALDLLLSFSLTLGILILLLALYSERPLDFSVFPSLLLIVTLMRLGLNVASTRLILLRGAEGPHAAGNVIRSFGDFSVGGNYLVGIVLFVIFVVINFVVITKGAGRIAEVAARFTLDALPGKQMSIDADLNQGVISDADAKQRRSEVQREADFYGAMDGASKFVRGDAIAGIVILLVNIVGGLSIGVLQEGMPLGDAVQSYTILTVGDGLVTQVPALIVSTAAGVVVSRAASGAPLAEELREQMVFRPRALGVAGGILCSLALVPGLPFVPFVALGGAAAVLSRVMASRAQAAAVPEAEEAAAAPPEVDEEAEIRRALAVDDLELEIGYGLIPLVDPERGGELLARIRALRKQVASELGFVVPLIHIRDNLQLGSEDYSILLRGNMVASGQIRANRLLAIGSGEDAAGVPGIPAREPAFGLPALWVQERDRDRASAAGYAVVDAATALATHLSEVLRDHASELLSRQQVRDLVDQLAERSPKAVEGVVPEIVPLATLHRTLRELLAERISIRDLATVVEALAELAPRVQDPEQLTELVRERLGRTITAPHLERDGTLRVITLAPDVEEALRGSLQRGEGGASLAIDPPTFERLVVGVERALASAAGRADGRPPVLLSSQSIRSPLRKIVSRLHPRAAVIAHNELPRELRVMGADVVRLADAH